MCTCSAADRSARWCRHEHRPQASRTPPRPERGIQSSSSTAQTRYQNRIGRQAQIPSDPETRQLRTIGRHGGAPRWWTLSSDPLLSARTPARLAIARDLLRAKRQPERQTGGISARRPRRGDRALHASFLRPAALPHRVVRSARLRRESPARRAARQYDLGPG